MRKGLHDMVKWLERNMRQREAQQPKPLYTVGPVGEDGLYDVNIFLPGQAPRRERMTENEINQLNSCGGGTLHAGL